MGKISQHWHNISQEEKYAEAGAAMEGGGNRECRVQEAGCSTPLPPPPPHTVNSRVKHGSSGNKHRRLEIACMPITVVAGINCVVLSEPDHDLLK